MTENEIIQILKDNKEKGIGFIFMPEEVRMWITSNLNKLMYYNGDINKFEKMEERTNCRNYYDLILTIDDSKFIKDGWVEFEIDEDGFFNVDDCGNEDEEGSFNFQWHQWSEFLNYSYGEKWRFTAFGGWKYKNNKSWFTTPQVEIDDGCLSYNYCIEAKPAIPIKIRFWREVK